MTRVLPTIPTFVSGPLSSASLNTLANAVAFCLNVPSFRMYQSLAQSIPNTTDTQLIMDTPDYDSDTGRSLVSPYGYTIPSNFAGRWQFTVSYSAVANATGERQPKLYKNGALVTGAEEGEQSGPGTANTAESLTITIACAAGDQVGAYAWQSSGGALNTNVGTNCSYFEGRLVSLANP